MLQDGWWILVVEAGVALGLLLLIVWSTWPRRDPARREPPPAPADTRKDDTHGS